MNFQLRGHQQRKKKLSIKCGDGYTLLGLCKVRWVIRCKALARFEFKPPKIILTLRGIEENDHDFEDEEDKNGEWNLKTRAEASGLAKGLSSFSFAITLVVTLRCWRVTDGLCIALQGPTKDVVAGYEYVDSVAERLSKVRCDIESVF